jgi:metal-responsive CopG/Arc/MetJ family transcriptional regulator
LNRINLPITTTMQETTVQLPDTLRQSVERLAQQTGITFDHLIQTAIEAYLQQQTPLPPSIGIGNSGLTQLSEQTHDRLWQDSQH